MSSDVQVPGLSTVCLFHEVDHEEQQLQGLEQEEQNEDRPVVLADAVVHPGAVVVERCYALFALVTVPHSEWL